MRGSASNEIYNCIEDLTEFLKYLRYHFITIFPPRITTSSTHRFFNFLLDAWNTDPDEIIILKLVFDIFHVLGKRFSRLQCRKCSDVFRRSGLSPALIRRSSKFLTNNFSTSRFRFLLSVWNNLMKHSS